MGRCKPDERHFVSWKYRFTHVVPGSRSSRDLPQDREKTREVARLRAINRKIAAAPERREFLIRCRIKNFSTATRHSAVKTPTFGI